MKRDPSASIPTPQSPIAAASRKAHNEQVESLVLSRDRWMWTAFGALAVALCTSIGQTYVSSRPPLPPYVVKVDKLGARLVVARADTMDQADPEIITGQLASFVSDIRVVYTDVNAQTDALNRAAAFVPAGQPSWIFLNQWVLDHEPWDRAKTETITVQIDSALPNNANTTWRIDWTEYHTARNGTPLPKENWRADLTVFSDRAKDGTFDTKNPTGTYISDIKWTKMLSTADRS